MTQNNELASIPESTLENRLKDFSDLLTEIENLSEKKKQLWIEIYQNSVSDRQNAFLMFAELYKIVMSKPVEHAIHAKSMSSYLERMAKSNDQLIKLAELIASETKKADSTAGCSFRKNSWV